MHMTDMSVVAADIKSATNKLLWNPIVMSIFWLPNTIATIANIFVPLDNVVKDGYVLNWVSNLMAILPGVILPVICFVYDVNVQQQWRKFWQKGFSTVHFGLFPYVSV